MKKIISTLVIFFSVACCFAGSFVVKNDFERINIRLSPKPAGPHFLPAVFQGKELEFSGGEFNVKGRPIIEIVYKDPFSKKQHVVGTLQDLSKKSNGVFTVEGKLVGTGKQTKLTYSFYSQKCAQGAEKCYVLEEGLESVAIEILDFLVDGQSAKSLEQTEREDGLDSFVKDPSALEMIRRAKEEVKRLKEESKHLNKQVIDNVDQKRTNDRFKKEL